MTDTSSAGKKTALNKTFVKIFLICILAAAANTGLNILSKQVLKIPLFLDTVFTAAITFSMGLLPGLLTAFFTQAVMSIREGIINPFIICSFAEVLLICWLSPIAARNQAARNQAASSDVWSGERTVASWVSVFAGLLLLYIVSCLAISVLGGLIDFVYHAVLGIPKPYFSAEDTFKISLMRSDIPTLAINILSRIPVNIVDRFVVIFGGFFLSIGLKRFL